MDLFKQLTHQITEIETLLGYSFSDKKYLLAAFTHRSFLNEYKEELEVNERLEFLGDAILGLIVSDHLFRAFPDMPEGELSPLRSRIVDAKSCAALLEELKLQDYLLLGKGQKLTLERGRLTIHADLFEAILGAIYLDGGLPAARDFFFRHFSAKLHDLIEAPDCNFKALLQHYAQREGWGAPIYEILSEEGPDHQKHFRIAATVNGEVLGEGEGESKKSSQQEAAKAACIKLGLV